MHSARLATQAAIVLLLVFVSLVAPDVLAAPAGTPFGYGVVFDNDSMTYNFVSLPDATTIAPLDVQLLAATFIGDDYTTEYAIDVDANLVTVDTATGDTTLIGSLGVAAQPRVSLGADPQSGALYGILGDNNCFATLLYSIDRTTAAATLIAPLPECVASIAYDPAGLLYLLDVGADALNVVDTLGNETTLGPLGILMNPSARVVVDPVSGALYLIEFDLPSFTNLIFAVDTATGAATLVGPLGGENPIGAPLLAPAPAGPPDMIFADGFDPPARVH